MRVAEYRCVFMRGDVSLRHQQVSVLLIFTDDRILSFKRHDKGVCLADIDINGL